MAMKQCAECREWYDEIFFARTGWAYAYTKSGTRPICLGCQRTRQDQAKAKDRWPTKIRDVIRRHAARLGVAADMLRDRYRWDFDQMVHEAQHAYSNGCQDCRKPFNSMGHGLADLTLDIWDRNLPPYYATNTRWICQSCNRLKSRTRPEVWGAKLAAWDAWGRRKPVPEPEQELLFEGGLPKDYKPR